MAKPKSSWICSACGAHHPKAAGFCQSCRKYNTLVEEVERAPSFRRGPDAVAGQTARRLGDVPLENVRRLTTGIPELDRVLGGGIVPGSMILVGGDPGIGKSTLLLQMCGRLEKQASVLYVSGEESSSQVALRAERLGGQASHVWLLPETRVEAVLAELQRLSPKVVVVDSIQTIYREDLESAPGTVSQLRESAAALLSWVKSTDSSVFLVGHVTKEGQLAGPRVLEHMVDTVLYFEGDRHHVYRLLRATKNRFGATGEVGVFEMRGSGLEGVRNPSALFLGNRPPLPGVCATSSMEGSRPLLVEIQALAGPTHFSMPQRVTTGLDGKRTTILLALLERHGGMHLGGYDVFLSVAGGLKLDDPGGELAATLAVASSLRDRPLPAGTIAIGELGLGGEIRPVPHLEARLKEARQLGFSRALIPKPPKPISIEGLQIAICDDLPRALDIALG
ncbi:MAG TPA: DNA repair protein RadA [Fibrobacteria bacterium]|nr:DNA repair protein RadA [Fibrobacteria bacterium]